MKRYTTSTRILLSLMVLFIGIGCGSPVPISDVSQAPFDDQLVGHWQTTADMNGDVVDMLILQFNDKEYYVELQEVDSPSSEEEVLRLRAYISDVEGHRFINAQTIDPQSEREFYFYTYAVQPDGSLTVQELQNVASQDINKFESSSALLTFVRQHLDNPDLYGQATSFARMPLAN